MLPEPDAAIPPVLTARPGAGSDAGVDAGVDAGPDTGPADDATLADLLAEVDAVLLDPAAAADALLEAAARRPEPTARQRLAEVEAAIAALDLTTLEATDTPARVRALAERALAPDPEADPIMSATCPRVAAVCVYPDLVAVAVERLAGTGVRVASVAGAFPSGRSTLATRLADTRDALEAGADEIDMVIDRGAFLDGRYAKVLADVAATRRACDAHRPGIHLKVILETGELGEAAAIRRAGWLALLGGADVLKTSTGKVVPAATPRSAAVLAHTASAWNEATGATVGVKVAGGVRSVEDALGYLALVRAAGLPTSPQRFRIGASSLVDALVTERRRLLAG